MTPAGGNPSGPVSTCWIGRFAGVHPALEAPEAFVLAGIDWAGPPQARIELRARRARSSRGGWTPWVLSSVLGHDSDGGESAPYALVGEPVWTGTADAVQLRSDRLVEGVRVHLVNAAAVGEATRDAAAGAGVTATAAGVTATAAGVTATAAGVTATAAGALPLAQPRLPAGPGQPPIIARSAWAAGLEPRVSPIYGDVRLAFVHHSVNANGYARGEVAAMLRSIYYFHTYVRGWNDIGYNFAIDAYGRTWEARAGGIDQAVVGAQAGGYNLESFGAVLLGDFMETLPSTAARSALARLVAWKMALHGVPVQGRVTVEVDPPDAFYTRFRPGQLVSLPRIAGHRDGCTTDCPGNDMYFYGMSPLRSAVRSTIGTQVKLSLSVGPPPKAAHQVAPYAIAPGTKISAAKYLQLASVQLTAGDRLPLNGSLRTFAGSPLTGKAIELQRVASTRESTSESVLATAVTGADGVWAAELAPTENALLRALHTQRPAVASPLVIVAVAPAVELSVATDGAEIIATGTVRPAKPRVVLQAETAGGKHRSVLRETIRAAAGAFRHRLTLPAGRYWLTATTMPDADNVAGASPRIAVRVELR